MRLLFLTDTHIRAHVAVRSDDYFEAVCTKLQEVGELADRYGVAAVIHGGDLFDLPIVANRLAGRVASILRGYGHLYVVPGNHDLIGHNLATVDQTTLGLLARAGVLRLLTRAEPVFLQADGLLVKLVGQEYYPEMDRCPGQDYAVERGGADYCILVAHGMLLPKPFHPDVPYTTFDQVPPGADLILAGHWHPGWPPTSLPGGSMAVNPGSLARLDRGGETYARDVQVVLVEVRPSRIDFDLIPLSSARPAAQVFVPREVKDDCAATVDGFASTLAEQLATLSSDQGVDVFGLLDSFGLPPEEHALARAYLEQACAAVHSHDWPAVPNLLHTLQIKGFQSHLDTFLEFGPGLNVITGPSDAGKSAILRALWWLLYNQPRGEETINEGSCEQFVQAGFDRGTIARCRTRTSNGWYQYAQPGCDPVTLKGFGTEVPPVITEIHQMPLVELTDAEESVNIATQFAPPFLLGATPAQRAVLLDTLANAQGAQQAASLAAKEQHAAASALAAVTTQLEAVEKDLAALPDYDLLLDKVNKARVCFSKAEEKRRQREEAAGLLTRLTELAKLRGWAEAKYRVLPEYLANAIALLDRVAYANRQSDDATGLLLRVGSLTRRLAAFRLVAAQSDLLSATAGTIAKAEFAYARLHDLQVVFRNHSDLVRRKVSVQATSGDLSRCLEEAMTDYHKLLASFQVCPVCGSSLSLYAKPKEG